LWILAAPPADQDHGRARAIPFNQPMSNGRSANILKALVRPETLVRAFLKKFSLGSYQLRMAFDAFERPWYAQGMYAAAELARRLREPAVSVIEFGVAHGDGLAAMEKLASELRSLLKIKIEIFGFDSGEGLPTHRDYRDLPYVWRGGLYKMNVEAVRRRLPTARLVLGDVNQTVPAFLETGGFPPIGFIAFDLDYYTSTRSALRIFAGPENFYLPRVLTYFDDIMSGEQQYYCEDVGELLALREFNEQAGPHHHRIRPLHGWRRSLPLEPAWTDAMWVYHRFSHSRYNEFIGK
jgi:hypothetical protein